MSDMTVSAPKDHSLTVVVLDAEGRDLSTVWVPPGGTVRVVGPADTVPRPRPVPWGDLIPEPLPMVSKCPKCGLSLSGTPGYVCGSLDCPTFPNVRCGHGKTHTG